MTASPADPDHEGLATPERRPAATRVATPMVREPVEIAERDLTPARRARILARDGHRCRYPGCDRTTGLEVDHIVALGLGGRDSDENLETLCAAHHRQKTKRDAGLIAKAKRAGAKHRGKFPPSKARIRSRGFPPTRDWTDDAS
jgi:5-methylcytosine-specific restriction endonuclease McrA